MNHCKQPTLSIVIPLYNEELVINEMYNRIAQLIDRSGLNFEIILINDGSGGGTRALAQEICNNDKRFKLISFSRNFGHQIAITVGLDKAVGKAVVIIDADLQDPPELIPQMMNKWQEGYHVVYGVRRRREGEGWFKRITASIFYRTLRLVTNVDIPFDVGDFRLMDRKVVEQLFYMRERSRFVRGMVSWVGFKQCNI